MIRASLAAPLRRQLRGKIREARVSAEAGAAAALRHLGVSLREAPGYLTEAERALRRRLRAHARTLGDPRREDGTQEVARLTEQTAYAHWHRMLFSRFLAERRLLVHPEHRAPVTLEDCKEIAEEEGAPDGFSVAERFAAAMLPGAFRPDDPVLAITLAPEHAQALQRLVTELAPEIFAADDSLGWTYQFWREAEKAEVNKRGNKIGAAELPAVTQLFTEPYMVRFLLHNTLGAWWAGKVLAADPALAREAADEDALRAACALPGIAWEFLRFVRDDGNWRPAAGIFPGWPARAAEITLLDPCCGSGHFLVEAFFILAALREREEGKSAREAVASVLEDNLFGLEIDERCVQIAVFAVALAAWRIGDGFFPVPNPHIAWVGAPPPLPRGDFVALANGDAELGRALAALHDCFVQAPLLGSLMRPSGGDLVDPLRLARVEEQFDRLVARLRTAEPERAEGAIAARGMADAAAILARRFVLQATNVPFLGRGNQAPELADFIARVSPEAKADLATAMLARMLDLAAPGGSIGAVSPQNWLFLGSYKKWRERVLRDATLNAVAGLGPRGFVVNATWDVGIGLAVLTAVRPQPEAHFAGLDANDAPGPVEKAEVLRAGGVRVLAHAEQARNPDARISVQPRGGTALLGTFAGAYQGITSGDNDRYVRSFWDVVGFVGGWRALHSTADSVEPFVGRNFAIWWGSDGAHIARPQGAAAWGKQGVSVSQMRELPTTLYHGALFDMNASAIIPHNPAHLPAIWCFCSSPEYAAAVRRIDQALKVTNATLVKVPFDLAHWQKVGEEKYPNGLPEPYSDDPTQWLFHGHPAKAEKGTAPHVALARLAGYRWPAESDDKMRLSAEAREWIALAKALPAADADGILPLPAVGGARPLAEQLRGFLATSFGAEWSDALERRLIAEADERFEKKQNGEKSLETWLRDRAFRQHFSLFHRRPFLWQVWDGQKDGFSAFLHYHRLTRATLEKLAFTVLNDWIGRMQAANDSRRAESGRILQQGMEKILAGEKPFDIFVRWKPLAGQPLGWDPDLDDGVRMNIRPFVEADLLRENPGISWKKDRGKDVTSAPWFETFQGERINEHHTTLAEKRAARERS